MYRSNHFVLALSLSTYKYCNYYNLFTFLLMQRQKGCRLSFRTVLFFSDVAVENFLGYNNHEFKIQYCDTNSDTAHKDLKLETSKHPSFQEGLELRGLLAYHPILSGF